MNNRVFNNSIRVVKDVHFHGQIAASENESSCATHNFTDTDRDSRVESKQIF